MITAIAIDDEPLALAVITAFCGKVDFIDLQKTFTDTKEAMRYIRQYPVDLMFLDIHMPAMSGIEFFKAAEQNAMVIFTTAFSDYAVEGFNMNAVDYLLKPFDYNRFKQAADKANDYYKYLHHKATTAEKHLYIRADYSLVKVPIEDILYIEGLDNYLKIHMANKPALLARMSMKAMEEKLPADEFIRIHRSYIVPKTKVDSLRNKTIYLPNGIELPVGTNYVELVQGLFK